MKGEERSNQSWKCQTTYFSGGFRGAGTEFWLLCCYQRGGYPTVTGPIRVHDHRLMTDSHQSTKTFERLEVVSWYSLDSISDITA